MELRHKHLHLNPSTGPTSVGVGPGQLLGSDITLHSNMGLAVGGTTSVSNGGTFTIAGGSLNTANLVVDGTASGKRELHHVRRDNRDKRISVIGGGVADFAGMAIATVIPGPISVTGSSSQFKVEQGAVLSATGLTNTGGQIVAGRELGFDHHNNVTNGGVVNLAGGELDIRGTLTNSAGSTIQGNGTPSTTQG